ncbi:MAG TPA: three-Cys-motif partner protein TcmP [Solirubrobacteraceae bacterium]|jgi:three-Cys-motif partner protein
MNELVALEPLIELDLMNRYIAPRTAVWRNEGHLPWLINASVATGDRAPAASAEWAQNQKIGHRAEILRTLNITGDEETFLHLHTELSPYATVTGTLSGSLESSLEQVMGEIEGEPVFVLLDPFAADGVRIDALQRLLSRRGRKTELLVSLDLHSFEEMCSNSAAEKIDEIIGSSLWRKLWDENGRWSSLTRVSVLYRAALQRRGYAFARQLPLHAPDDQRPTSQLVFASRSRLGVALMSDLACRYRRERTQAPARQIKELRDRIHELGGRLGGASTNRIVQGLSPDLFGEFQITEYRKAIRDLVNGGVIIREDASGINDDEILTFSGTSQMALFDSSTLLNANTA